MTNFDPIIDIIFTLLSTQYKTELLIFITPIVYVTIYIRIVTYSNITPWG